MISVTNHSPWPLLCYPRPQPDSGQGPGDLLPLHDAFTGEWILLVKTSWTAQGNSLDLQWVEAYQGVPGESPLKSLSDLGEPKALTELTILGGGSSLCRGLWRRCCPQKPPGIFHQIKGLDFHHWPKGVPRRWRKAFALYQFPWVPLLYDVHVVYPGDKQGQKVALVCDTGHLHLDGQSIGWVHRGRITLPPNLFNFEIAVEPPGCAHESLLQSG